MKRFHRERGCTFESAVAMIRCAPARPGTGRDARGSVQAKRGVVDAGRRACDHAEIPLGSSSGPASGAAIELDSWAESGWETRGARNGMLRSVTLGRVRDI